MQDNEKRFESDIEEFLISPEGGWDKASDAGYCASKGSGMALDLSTLIGFVKDTQPVAWQRDVYKRQGQKRPVEADAVIVATGGLSYPTTGSSGDGYRFAAEAGLAVTECLPALVPFEVLEDDAKELQGLCLLYTSRCV